MRALIPLLVALSFVNAQLDCSCGFVVNSTYSEYYAIFTEILETDFLHVGNLQHDTSDAWIPQAYNTTPKQARGPYGKASQVENVKLNPLHNAWDWAGPGIRGQDPGLQLWTRDNLIKIPGTSKSTVPMSEIVSTRDDMLYGSFRIGVKATAVNGTCGAFFFYLNDTAEIDMEFLSLEHQNSSDSGTVHLVIQSEENKKLGYVEAGSPDYNFHSLDFSPAFGYNEFRFDWLPDRVDFYANGEIIKTITDNIPSSPGSLHIAHWSNGNQGWSAGPPTEDAVMTVSYVKAYFNSSDPHNTKKSLRGCQVGVRPGERGCPIPDQTTPPNPSGMNGNETAQTYFFSREMADPMASATPSGPIPTLSHRPTSGSGRNVGHGDGTLLYWTVGLSAGMFAFHGIDVFRALHAGLGIRAP
jgi:hypothetical protein